MRAGGLSPAGALPAVIVLETTGSTNDDAKTQARDGAAEGTVVHARRQTAGRGRLGNQWMSETGNLYMSIVLRPQVSAMESGQLSFLAAVALAQTAESFLPQGSDIALKWPNDLLVNGRKAAGILLESESMPSSATLEWLVIGMGLNLRHAPEGAVALGDLAGTEIDVDRARDLLIGNMLSLYRRWQVEGFAPVRSAWLDKAARVGQPIRVRLPAEEFTAVFDGIDARGALEVTMQDGAKRVIASGEVFAI